MLTLPIRKPKIAIVHDFLTYFGGAEQVLKSLHNLYPQAPIYTLLYDKEKMQGYFPAAKIRTSFLNKFPKFIKKGKKYLLPLFSTAVETFDLRDYDIVISSCNSFVKGIITKPKTIHICYCHAPTRFLWDWHYNYLDENKVRGIKKIFITPILHYMRMWDKSAADRVDYFIANSQNTADKIKKFYGRGSKIIYPPCDINHTRGFHSSREFRTVEPEARDLHMWFHSPKGTMEPSDYKKTGKNIQNYFLIVSRLSPYKKIDVAIKAFNKLEIPLVIIGEGEDRKRLEKIAGKNIRFLGFQPEGKIAQYYKSCQAFIFSGEDDFGITPIEAMSFGKPVLAYRKGGALETVVEGVTGEFFDDPIPEILADGVRRIKNNCNNYNVERIKEQAKKFSREKFERNIKEFIEHISEQRGR
jgi:glycosyltransferase involved in cell wall biosynthesis